MPVQHENYGLGARNHGLHWDIGNLRVEFGGLQPDFCQKAGIVMFLLILSTTGYVFVGACDFGVGLSGVCRHLLLHPEWTNAFPFAWACHFDAC